MSHIGQRDLSGRLFWSIVHTGMLVKQWTRVESDSSDILSLWT